MFDERIITEAHPQHVERLRPSTPAKQKNGGVSPAVLTFDAA
jgi:hypothetical protein